MKTLDSELRGRTPAQRSHKQDVGTTVMYHELLCKVIQGIKVMSGVKAFLFLSVAALLFSVVAWNVGTNEFVQDFQFDRGT